MGYWGAGVFENDRALDWILDLRETDDLSFVRQTLWSIVSNSAPVHLSAGTASEALAAAEIVSAVFGVPCSRFDISMKNNDIKTIEWIEKNRSKAEPQDIQLALQALERIQNNSELSTGWFDDAEAAEWQGLVVDLEDRLTSAQGALGPQEPMT